VLWQVISEPSGWSENIVCVDRTPHAWFVVETVAEVLTPFHIPRSVKSSYMLNYRSDMPRSPSLEQKSCRTQCLGIVHGKFAQLWFQYLIDCSVLFRPR